MRIQVPQAAGERHGKVSKAAGATVVTRKNSGMRRHMTTEAVKKEVTSRFYAAINARDVNLLKAILTEDVVWSLPGKSLMSGEALGVAAILKRAEILNRYGVKVEIEHVVYGFKDVALRLHNTGRHEDKTLDEHLTNVYVLRGNKICRIDTFISDVDMLNAFFV
jgi:ketosteroid isomerase-like protein